MKDKKNVRQRGSKTHGCGSMKKRRGAGNRGGRGMAGTGKRGDCKKPSIWKKKYFGPSGFTSKYGVIKAVNLLYLEDRAETLAKDGIIEKDGDIYVVDLKNLGYQKLLSKGKTTKKFRITCVQASKSAIEKVKNLGGEVIVQNVAVEDNTE